MNLAVCGLRHVHIHTLIALCGVNPEVNLVGAFEADDAARLAAREALPGLPFYDTYGALLADPQVEAVAVGDYYGIRGERTLQALEAGKHVISDKPLCTRMEELDTIGRLCRGRGLCLGCLLDLRYDPALRLARSVVQAGQLGAVHDVSFTGQHPLSWGVRPSWYFEPGKHGGTFNDIAVHGLDAVRFITGMDMARVDFARSWNAFAKEAPDFPDCAQAALTLTGGAALMLDVSYAAPHPSGMILPPYWRFTFWGEGGFLEARLGDGFITLALAGDEAARQIPAEAVPGNPLSDFLEEVKGGRPLFDTESILTASRSALALQAAADSMRKEG